MLGLSRGPSNLARDTITISARVYPRQFVLLQESRDLVRAPQVVINTTILGLAHRGKFNFLHVSSAA